MERPISTQTWEDFMRRLLGLVAAVFTLTLPREQRPLSSAALNSMTHSPALPKATVMTVGARGKTQSRHARKGKKIHRANRAKGARKARLRRRAKK